MLSRTSSSSSSVMGDYIGDESCSDIFHEEHDNFFVHKADCEKREEDRGDAERVDVRIRDQRPRMTAVEKRKEKYFPPPIPSLALASLEHMPSHMPWVLKRYHTHDGRLILREEKARHHEYFRANRSDGRLTLQLVALNDDVYDLNEEDEDAVGGGEGALEEDNGGADIVCDEEHCIQRSSGTSSPPIKCFASNLHGMQVQDGVSPVQS